MVTPGLFARYPDAAALAGAKSADVEEIIRSTGFFRAKTRSLLGLARGLMERHGGEIPREMATLVKLPGIGRKTANVVLGHAFDVNEGIAVDTHVLRLANRIGLVDVDDPVKVEGLLMELIPRERWTRTTDLIIFHGRKVCDARRPACGTCPIFTLCGWESRQAWAASEPPAPARRGRVAREATPRRPAARAKRSPARVNRAASAARRPRGRTGSKK
jgi:endonuclease-3